MVIRGLGGLLAVNRVLFGIGYLIAPQRTASSWIGRAGRKPATTVTTRALGARDLALGAGALSALAQQNGSEARRWFAAHAIADATDLAATLLAREDLPDSGFRFGAAMSAGSTAIAVASALGLRASGES